MSKKTYENGDLIPEILYLRYTKARMLGHDNFEAQVVGPTMAGNIESLERTLNTLEAGYQLVGNQKQPDDIVMDEPSPTLGDPNVYFDFHDVERLLQIVIQKYFGLELQDVTADFPVYRAGMRVCGSPRKTGRRVV